MRAIGFRAAPSAVTYAVVEQTGDTTNVLVSDSIPVPSALLAPQQLHFLRTVLLDVMEEYGVTRAGLRLPEGLATPRVARTYIEGVLQELLASSAVTWYFCGNKSRIAKHLGFGSDQPRLTALIDGALDPDDMPSWKAYSAEQREAVLTAWAAILGKSELEVATLDVVAEDAP